MKLISPFLYIGGILLIVTGLFSDILILAVLGVIGILSLPFILRQEKNENKSQTIMNASEIFAKREFNHYFIGKDNLTCIGLCEERNEILLLSRNQINEVFKEKTIPFSKLFEVKLIEDDLALLSTSRGSQLGGALAGAVLAGGIGAIIGGMGATQYEEQEVRKINLELVIDDLYSPIFTISFMNEDLFYKKYEPVYKDYFNKANSWYKSLTVILKRNDVNIKSV